VSQQQMKTSVFDAAKAIVEALKGLDKPSQTLAIRFASESLGVSGVAMQSPPAVGAPSPMSQPEVRGATHSTDIKQFTAAKAPKSDQQFAAVAAYFYRFEASESARKDTVDANTLKEAARLAGRRQAKNWTFTLTNAKNSGYLDSAGSGQYRINSVGENLVAIALPGDDSASAPKRRSKRKATKSSSGIKRNAKPRR
jgi:hypothetical protein